MYWTKEHDLLLVTDVLAVDSYGQQRWNRERSKLWQGKAPQLNAITERPFSLSLTSVRGRLIDSYKKTQEKMSERKARPVERIRV